MFEGFERAEVLKLRETASLGEDFIQRMIEDDPSLLGLGDLVVKERERRQRGGGRLDFLLQDSPLTTRYAVEIQLGSTDPSHIIRTIEYWDKERRISPQFEHVAVIVAEEITSRFFNVISLFNQHIPLIAIKMSALQVGSNKTVLFTKILDYTPTATEDEEAGVQETDRSYWEKRSSPATMALVDSVVTLAKNVDPSIGPRFNKGSIPLKVGSEFWRFLTLWPKKKFLKMSVPISQSTETEEQLNSADIDFEGYDELRKRYVLTLSASDLPKHNDLIRGLIATSYKRALGSPEVAEE